MREEGLWVAHAHALMEDNRRLRQIEKDGDEIRAKLHKEVAKLRAWIDRLELPKQNNMIEANSLNSHICNDGQVHPVPLSACDFCRRKVDVKDDERIAALKGTIADLEQALKRECHESMGLKDDLDTERVKNTSLHSIIDELRGEVDNWRVNHESILKLLAAAQIELCARKTPMRITPRMEEILKGIQVDPDMVAQLAADRDRFMPPWTSVPPTEAGFYWIFRPHPFHGESRLPVPAIIRHHESVEIKNLMVWPAVGPGFMTGSLPAHYLGPIQTPEPPSLSTEEKVAEGVKKEGEGRESPPERLRIPMDGPWGPL